MFKKKEEEKEEVPREVKCEVCKHKIDREDAQEVKDKKTGIGGYYFDTEIHYEVAIYFCPMHVVSWDRRDDKRYFKTIPAHEIEVTVDGKEITKINSKE